ncbi:unnamed protein product [Ambrosiozyma monospora]|uniref:Unnamed protein product n=1 Tax=Ambrosiozyma monospora TaxID=43982 RepID=A0A9W6YVL4_AMBMO|nr:unnamed protein product [Ambrosiozyma monospora]
MAAASHHDNSLPIKEKEWIGLIKFSRKIIDNFGNLERSKMRSNAGSGRRAPKNMNYCIGLLHYLNYFIIQLLIDKNQTKLQLILKTKNGNGKENESEVDDDEGNGGSSNRGIDTAKLISVNRKLLQLNKTAKNYYRKADTLFKNHEMSARFPKMQNNGRVSIKDVKFDEFRLNEFNYYLPIVDGNFNLITMVNFSLHFLKIWIPDDIKYDWAI